MNQTYQVLLWMCLLIGIIIVLHLGSGGLK